jgi:hypothetical protein
MQHKLYSYDEKLNSWVISVSSIRSLGEQWVKFSQNLAYVVDKTTLPLDGNIMPTDTAFRTK